MALISDQDEKTMEQSFSSANRRFTATAILKLFINLGSVDRCCTFSAEKQKSFQVGVAKLCLFET